MATTQTAASTAGVRDVKQKPQAADEFIHHDHIGHGSTPAAWALCVIVIIGSALAAVGFIGLAWTSQWAILIWIGAALMPVAIVVGVVMKRMGYGVELDADAVLRRGSSPREHSGPATPDQTAAGAQRRQPEASVR
ncbi:MAG: HGxxPAAW family protein [Nesterenkonia sp.]